MNNASRHALNFLIVSFIICALFLFAGLYVYHIRSLSDEKPRSHINFKLRQATQNTEEVETARPGNMLRDRMRAHYAETWISIRDREAIISRARLTAAFALIHTLKLLPALILFLFITAFSIFYTLPPFSSETFQYHHVAIPSYFTMLGLIALIIVAEFLFIPRLYRGSEGIIYRSRVAQAALAEARRLVEDDDLHTSKEVMDIYLEIDNSAEAARLYDDIMEGLYMETFGEAEQPERAPEPREGLPFFERGRIAFSQGDYYAALYYFERALSTTGEDKRVTEYLLRAQAEVDRLLGALSRDDLAVQRYIIKKEQAIGLIEQGNYYRAYDVLTELIRDRELQGRYPELVRDLEFYLNDVRDNLNQFDFLPDEIDAYAWLPSFDNIVFSDNQNFTNTVGRIIPWDNQFYFIDITRYRLEDNRLFKSERAYGKWLGGRVRLKIGREYRKIPEGKEELYNIEPPVSPIYLIHYNNASRLLNQLTLYERMTMSAALRGSGFDIEDRFVYLARELGIFFSVYVLTLLFSGLAWTKRSIYEFPPAFKLLLYVIVTPILCYLFHHLYLDLNSIFIYSHRYITRFLFSGINVAVYTGIINLFIAAVATFYFLAQRITVE
jgi:tetratricopeptide (TPR) repeat protein